MVPPFSSRRGGGRDVRTSRRRRGVQAATPRCGGGDDARRAHPDAPLRGSEDRNGVREGTKIDFTRSLVMPKFFLVLPKGFLYLQIGQVGITERLCGSVGRKAGLIKNTTDSETKMYKPPVKRWSDSSTSTRQLVQGLHPVDNLIEITPLRDILEVLGSIPIGRQLFVFSFFASGRHPRRPLSNEPLCASNGEVWGRWWTSTREGVCWCSETGEIFADREIFTNRRSKSTLISPVVVDQKAR